MRPHDLVLSALFCALTVVGAWISIPIPGGAVTLQLFFVLLSAFLLPPKSALFAIASYVLLGLCGAPVFVGFVGGLSAVASPTFGFLIGMVLAAPTISALYRRPKNCKGAALFSGIIGLLLLYLCGGLYASLLIKNAWSVFLTYLPVDLIKLVAAAALAIPLQSRLSFLKK